MSNCKHKTFYQPTGNCLDCGIAATDIVIDLTTRLAAVEKERDEWKRSSELVARVLIDTKADLTAAMKDKPKGRFLPDIEDLSHTIDFEKPKCGECGGTHCVDTPFSGSDPSCPDCKEVDGDL